MSPRSELPVLTFRSIRSSTVIARYSAISRSNREPAALALARVLDIFHLAHSLNPRLQNKRPETVANVYRPLTEVDTSSLIGVSGLLNPHLKVALVIRVDHPEDGVNVAFNRVTACRVTRVVLRGMMEG